jgi:4'-phosphopantetheinyl transferase EntD
MTQNDSELAAALATIALSGILVGYRRIEPSDGLALLAVERTAFAQAVEKVRRQSGAARLVARALAQQLGYRDLALPTGPSRAPIWPRGLTGSLAHDETFAVAAVALSCEFAGIGIDVEPATPLPADVMRSIATDKERARYSASILNSRLLFVIKEAVYKAQFPVDGQQLGFTDVEVDLDSRTARTPTRHVKFSYCEAPRVLALAYIPHSSSPGSHIT